MIDPADRRAPMNPQLALRVGIMGVGALVLFGIIFFRLWYLQVLSGDVYLKQARDNRVRVERVAAPRGQIEDASGTPLVENRPATLVQLTPQSLPQSERTAAARWGQLAGRRAVRHKGHEGPKIPIPPIPTPRLADRLKSISRIIDVSVPSLQRILITKLSQIPYANITLKTDATTVVREYFAENRDQYPGVRTPLVYLRRYPQKQLAAQLVGTIGEINGDQLKQARYQNVKAGTIIGQDGIEKTYDQFLRGTDGISRTIVDSLGNPKGQPKIVRQPQTGQSVQLSLDLGLESVAQKAVLRAGGGLPAAYVAMDPKSGAVYALGSYPSVDPNALSRARTQSAYDKLTNKDAGSPLFPRAIAGGYPTGSIFKPITALASLTSGTSTPSTTVDDTGCITVGSAGQKFCNAGHAANGSIDLVNAIRVSSDVYFYTLGEKLNALPHEVLQSWAHKMGLGRPTGIDLPGEEPGLVPDRAWRRRVGLEEIAYEKKHHVACCTISDKRPWSIGDEVNLAVGQGDLQASPLQMAVVYSTLAESGNVPVPHLGAQVVNAEGVVDQKIHAAAGRHVAIPAADRDVIMEGLHEGASAAGGTSAKVWEGWNQSRFPVYGKTGTAEHTGQPDPRDQSWYVCYIKDTDTGKSLVVAVTIEHGGFGAAAAAPAARLIASKFFGQKAKFIVGDSPTH